LALISQRQPFNRLLGVDVSWPNCKVSSTQAAFGIVGVTGGLDFQDNNCLRSEAALFSNPELYMNSGWPGTGFHLQFRNSPESCARSDNLCLAFNYGYHAAEYAINYANRNLVHSPNWWIDVETDNSWTNNIVQNQAAIAGMVASIKQNVPFAKIGIYAYPGQWTELVSSWKPNLLAWLATGGSQFTGAQKACSSASFTAQPVKLAQFTNVLDQDLACQD